MFLHKNQAKCRIVRRFIVFCLKLAIKRFEIVKKSEKKSLIFCFPFFIDIAYYLVAPNIFKKRKGTKSMKTKKPLSIFLVLCLLLSVIPMMSLTASAGVTPSVYVRSATDYSRNTIDCGTDNYFRKSELLEVVPVGFSVVESITYTPYSTNDYSVYFHYYNTRDMSLDNGVTMYSAVEESYTVTFNERWFSLKDRFVTYPQNAKIVITVFGKNQSGKYTDATITLTGFLAANLAQDMNQSVLALWQNESMLTKDLYGFSGVTHVSCENCSTTSATVTDASIAQVIYDANTNPLELKGLKIGKTYVTATLTKNKYCDHHDGQTASATNPVYVLGIPVDNGDGTATVVTPANSKLTYIIDGNTNPIDATNTTSENSSVTFPVTNTGTVEFSVQVRDTIGEKEMVVEKAGTFTMEAAKPEYNGTKTTEATIYSVEGSAVDVTLPTIPGDASYGTPVSSNAKVGGTISGNKLTLTVNSALVKNTDADFTVTVPVTGSATYRKYNIIVSVGIRFGYAVTCATCTNGTISTNKTAAAEGENITVTATPNSGYELDTLTYTVSGGSPVDIKSTKSFTMPANAVTVDAAFKLIPEVASVEYF
ncbi:MAG TPA: hypothetical protein DDY98_02000, partial [Ruminococcaceae bacterium]|nr:hypothetical protein [Oscillospiraceae bacterium]